MQVKNPQEKKTVSFRVSSENRELLELVKSLERNCSQFINEAIRAHGPHLIEKIKEDGERAKAYEEANRDLLYQINRDREG